MNLNAWIRREDGAGLPQLERTGSLALWGSPIVGGRIPKRSAASPGSSVPSSDAVAPSLAAPTKPRESVPPTAGL